MGTHLFGSPYITPFCIFSCYVSHAVVSVT